MDSKSSDDHEVKVQLPTEPASIDQPTPTLSVMDDEVVVDYFTDDTSSGKYVEMLMRNLPNGSLLHQIIDATRCELGITTIPVLFATDQAFSISPERFCGWCKVHLGVWDAFHGGVVEMMGGRVCSNHCLENYEKMEQEMTLTFEGDSTDESSDDIYGTLQGIEEDDEDDEEEERKQDEGD